MTIEEKCAEKYTPDTGGYLVCVEETRQHDATVEVAQCIAGAVIFVAFMVALIFASRDK